MDPLRSRAAHDVRTLLPFRAGTPLQHRRMSSFGISFILQQRGGVHEVGRRESFCERFINGGKRGAGLVAAALSLPEPGEAHRGPQLERPRLAMPRDRDGLAETSFGVRRMRRIKGQQELPLESVQFWLVETYASLLDLL